jgi:hypothetical protein
VRKVLAEGGGAPAGRGLTVAAREEGQPSPAAGSATISTIAQTTSDELAVLSVARLLPVQVHDAAAVLRRTFRERVVTTSRARPSAPP